MPEDNPQSSLETLHEIRSIMERSARFISLSGWSGIWAGCTGLAAAIVAGSWERQWTIYFNAWHGNGSSPALEPPGSVQDVLILAVATFAVAFLGSFFFTWRKTRRQGARLWNVASRRLLLSAALPLLAGAAFAFCFLQNGLYAYLVPLSLAFYGMALLNGSKYTLSEIRYLGYAELVLGCISLFFPDCGLYFWAAGFGMLHIVYGILMWFKYDRHGTQRS